jgi:hypothetical protein
MLCRSGKHIESSFSVAHINTHSYTHTHTHILSLSLSGFSPRSFQTHISDVLLGLGYARHNRADRNVLAGERSCLRGNALALRCGLVAQRGDARVKLRVGRLLCTELRVGRDLEGGDLVHDRSDLKCVGGREGD